MNTYEFVQVVLYLLGGEIKSRTKLQKTVYFLALTSGRKPEDYGFRPYLYGPYSEEVAEAVDRLKSLGFADETIASSGSVDIRGFEVARRDTKLTPEGRQIARSKWESLTPSEQQKFNSAIEMLRRGGDADYIKLSIAAKTLFLMRQQGAPSTNHDLAKLAPKFGWDVNAAQILDAFQFLKSLDLIQSPVKSASTK